MGNVIVNKKRKKMIKKMERDGHIFTRTKSGDIESQPTLFDRLKKSDHDIIYDTEVLVKNIYTTDGVYLLMTESHNSALYCQTYDFYLHPSCKGFEKLREGVLNLEYKFDTTCYPNKRVIINITDRKVHEIVGYIQEIKKIEISGLYHNELIIDGVNDKRFVFSESKYDDFINKKCAIAYVCCDYSRIFEIINIEVCL